MYKYTYIILYLLNLLRGYLKFPNAGEYIYCFRISFHDILFRFFLKGRILRRISAIFHLI